MAIPSAKLVAGLGNPGEKYRHTRHNAGFMILDDLAGSLKSEFGIKTPSYEALISRSGIEEFILLKPLTYMNRSGGAIAEFFNDYEGEISDLLIIIDDFNIPLGTIRIRGKGTDGGHNGIADIISQFGTDDFPRMRIGIGPEEPPAKEKFIDFVLEDFTASEMKILEKMMPIYKECIISFITEGLTKTMNTFNRSFIEEITGDNE
jgi:PTH1 family peptidyl-tRNA hydrolase